MDCYNPTLENILQNGDWETNTKRSIHYYEPSITDPEVLADLLHRDISDQQHIVLYSGTEHELDKVTDSLDMNLILIIEPNSIPVLSYRHVKGMIHPSTQTMNDQFIAIMIKPDRGYITYRMMREICTWVQQCKGHTRYEGDFKHLPLGTSMPTKKRYPLGSDWLHLKPPTEPIELWLSRSSERVSEWLTNFKGARQLTINFHLRKLLKASLSVVTEVWKHRCRTNHILSPDATQVDPLDENPDENEYDPVEQKVHQETKTKDVEELNETQSESEEDGKPPPIRMMETMYDELIDTPPPPCTLRDIKLPSEDSTGSTLQMVPV